MGCFPVLFTCPTPASLIRHQRVLQSTGDGRFPPFHAELPERSGPDPQPGVAQHHPGRLALNPIPGGFSLGTLQLRLQTDRPMQALRLLPVAGTSGPLPGQPRHRLQIPGTSGMAARSGPLTNKHITDLESAKYLARRGVRITLLPVMGIILWQATDPSTQKAQLHNLQTTALPCRSGTATTCHRLPWAREAEEAEEETPANM